MPDMTTWGGSPLFGEVPASPPCPTGCVGCQEHLVRPCCVLLEVTQRCNLSCPVCFANSPACGGGSDAGGCDAAVSPASTGINAGNSGGNGGGAGNGGGNADGGDAGSDGNSGNSGGNGGGNGGNSGNDGSSKQPDDPSLEHIAFLYDSLKAKAGICHIQLSGGEPTLRDDLTEIISIGRQKGFGYFQLNTNGLRLAAEPALPIRLKQAGLTCVFLQFDGLSEQSSRLLRGRDLGVLKRQAIDNCAAAKLPVVLVPTVAKAVNDSELMEVVRFAISKSPTVRGVHFQPVSLFGRYPQGTGRITIAELLAALEAQSAGMVKAGHFGGGSVEHPLCSFSANYLIDDSGCLEPLGAKANSCCGQPEPAAADTCCGQPELAAVISCCGAAHSPHINDGAAQADGVAQPNGATQADGVARAQDIQRERWGTDLNGLNGLNGLSGLSGLSDNAPSTAGSLDEFLWRTKARGFSITGMAFMDAWTLDIERLRRCYIFVMDNEGNPIPFCAYNLSDAQGRSLYR